MPISISQRQIAYTVLTARGISRLAELREAGVTAATMSRMERDGEVLRLARGIYQLSDAPLDVHHSLAETAKRIPKGVVCLVSALAFHGLTDQLPRQVWLAVGQKDWSPKPEGTPIRLVRFTDRLLTEGVETHPVERVPVKVFGVAETIADCFRYRTRLACRWRSKAFRKRFASAGRRRARSPGKPSEERSPRSFGPISRH